MLGAVLAALLVILLVLAVGKLAPLFIKTYKWRKYLDDKFPHWPISWIFGSLSEFSCYEELFKKATKSFVDEGKKAYIWWLGPFRCIVVTCHPDTCKVLLRSAQPKARGGGGYDLLKPWIGDGLLTSEGKKWERNRHLLTPAFHFEILKDYVETYNSVVEVFMDKMEKASKGEQYVDVCSPVVLAALDTLLRCALSYEDDIQLKGDSHPYVKAVKKNSELILKRSIQLHYYIDWIYYLSSDGRHFARLCDYVHKFASDIITHRRHKLSELSKSGTPGPAGKRKLDFLDILLTAKDEEGNGLTDGEIRDEVDTFMFAGHDTTSTAMDWCLYVLGTRQDVQQRVFDDVQRVMGDRTHVIWEDLALFQYLPLFIRESMRIYTTVPIISRELASPVEIEGVEIPKGVMVDISLYQLHNNKYVWERPEEFNPERFEKDTFAGKDPYMFVPFSAGPRNCIGQNFALNEIKTFMARIVRRFHLEADPSIDPEPYPEVTLRARNGIHIKFTPR